MTSDRRDDIDGLLRDVFSGGHEKDPLYAIPERRELPDNLSGGLNPDGSIRRSFDDFDYDREILRLEPYNELSNYDSKRLIYNIEPADVDGSTLFPDTGEFDKNYRFRLLDKNYTSDSAREGDQMYLVYGHGQGVFNPFGNIGSYVLASVPYTPAPHAPLSAEDTQTAADIVCAMDPLPEDEPDFDQLAYLVGPTDVKPILKDYIDLFKDLNLNKIPTIFKSSYDDWPAAQPTIRIEDTMPTHITLPRPISGPVVETATDTDTTISIKAVAPIGGAVQAMHGYIATDYFFEVEGTTEDPERVRESLASALLYLSNRPAGPEIS